MKKELADLSGPELQTELALMRTTLALDRTLLAWIRTSLTFIGFGFTLAKFINQITQAGYLHGLGLIESPKVLGLTMMTLGLTGLVGGSIDYWHTEKKLTSKAMTVSPRSISFIVALALSLLTIVLMSVLMLETTHQELYGTENKEQPKNVDVIRHQ